MATKSFLKTVNITGRKKIERFVKALDEAEEWRIAHQNDPKPDYYVVPKDKYDELLAHYDSMRKQ